MRYFTREEKTLFVFSRQNISNPQISNSTPSYNYLANSYGIIECITSLAHKVVNTYEADRNGLLSKQNSKLDNTAIAGHQCTMNHLGQRTSITRNGHAHATPDVDTIGYDAKGQVVKTDNAANTAFNRLYTFDGIGNRLSDNLSNYTVNSVNEITTVTTGATTVSTTHDDDGNMLTGKCRECKCKEVVINFECGSKDRTTEDLKSRYARVKFVKSTNKSTATSYDGTKLVTFPQVPICGTTVKLDCEKIRKTEGSIIV